MLEIQKLTENNFSKWDDFVQNHYPSLYALKTNWKIFLEKTFTYESLYFYFAYKNIVIGILPVFKIKSKICGNRYVSIPFSDIGGIYFSPEISDDKKQKCWDMIKELNMKLPFDFRGTNKSSTLFLTKNEDFVSFSPYVQMQILLNKEFSEIENNFSANIKRNLKTSDDITIKETNIFNKNLYKIYLKEMQKFGSPPLKFSFFKNQKTYLKENLIIFSAFRNSKQIGALTCISAGDTLYADLIMSDDKTSSKHPKHKLYLNALKYAKENNFKAFNLSRTRRESGVYEHKRRWGAKEKAIYCMHNHPSKNLFIDADNKKAKVISMILKHCPLKLLEIIGPILRNHLAK